MKRPVFVFASLIALYVLLIAFQRIFPFIDLPNHLAEATIYKFSESGTFDNFYLVRGGLEPNSFHYLFCSLFDNVETGNRIYYIIYVILLPLATVLLIHQQGGNWRFGFLSLLLVFNYNVTFGFAGFTMAIPIILFSFYLACIDSWTARIGLSLLLMVLFFVHVLGLLFALFLIFVLAVVKPHGIKFFLKQVCVIIPALILVFVWQTHAFDKEQSTVSFLLDYYLNHYFQEIILRSKILIYEFFVLSAGAKGVIIALFFLLGIVGPVALKLKNISYEKIVTFSKANKPIIAFLAVSSVCVLFLPGQLPGQGILYQRFAVMLLLSIIILGSILYKDSVHRSFQVAALACVLVHFILWYDYLVGFDKQNASFNAAFFDGIPKEEPLGAVIFDLDYRARPVYLHFANYHIVWNQGIAATKVIDYRFGSIKRVASKTRLPEYQEWGAIDGKIPPEYRDLKYLLLRSKPLNLQENVSTIRKEGQWEIVKLN